MSRRKLPTKVSRETFLEFGSVALENALALAEDARVLAASGRWARATGLMITAREEAAKAFYAVLLGRGLMPEKRPAKGKGVSSIRMLLGSHEMKQGMSASLMEMLTVLENCTGGPRLLVGFKREIKRMRAFPGQRPDRRTVEAMLKRTPGLMHCIIRSGRRVSLAYARNSERSELEIRRQACTYSDISSDGLTIESPSRIGEAEYVSQSLAFEKLKPMLEAARDLHASPAAFQLPASIAEPQAPPSTAQELMTPQSARALDAKS